MLNKKPIFILGFAGGGTGMLWDLIISHPNCMTPGPELNEIFYASPKRKVFHRLRLFGSAVINGFNFKYLKLFDYNNLQFNHFEKMLNSKNFISYVDKKCYELKLNRGLNHPADKFKYPDISYNENEIKRTRLVTKSLEGACLAAPFFNEVYRDVKFICIVRNGLAYAESKMRHKRLRNMEKAAEIYKVIGDFLFRFNQSNEKSVLIKYEDYVNEPKKTIEKIYEHLDLDIREIKLLKIQTKSYLGSDEIHKKVGNKYWYSFEELNNFFVKDLNKIAIKNLEKHQINEFFRISGDAFYKLGYEI